MLKFSSIAAQLLSLFLPFMYLPARKLVTFTGIIINPPKSMKLLRPKTITSMVLLISPYLD